VITEDDVMRLLERADPVRNRAAAVAPDPAGYLDSLRARSGKVTLVGASQRPGARRLMIPAAAAATVLLLLGVLALATRGDPIRRVSEQPPLSVETLAGIWSLAGSRDSTGAIEGDARGLLLMFGTDGTFAFDRRGNIDTSPDAAETYELDGDVVVTHRERGGCAEAIDFTVEMPEEGRLLTVVTDTGSGKGCVIPVGTESTWLRVSPYSPPGAATFTIVSSVDDTNPPSRQTIYGIWQRQGSGQLLRFGIDGTYAIDDGGLLRNPDDIGSYELDGDTITFTSAGSATCTAGDNQVWERLSLGSVRLQQEDFLHTRLLNVTAGDPECPIHSAGDQTWLRISP
jgi:hypothetical protein